MVKIEAELAGAKRIAITGHVRPDGDCIGSCTALYLYLTKYGYDMGIETVDVYLESFGNEFQMLTGIDRIKHSFEAEGSYDVLISLDCGSLDRLIPLQFLPWINSSS
jgi:phosphoesterase RecJ-like protein